MTDLTKQKGTYILLLQLPEDHQLTIGKLGTFNFPAGFYAYVGSAFGPGGLMARLKHHLTISQKPHWHIDYLRRVSRVQEVWLAAGTTSREEAWVDLLLDIPGAMSLFDGFGASDSKQDSHLIYFDLKPDIEDFEVGVHHQFPTETILKLTPPEEQP